MPEQFPQEQNQQPLSEPKINHPFANSANALEATMNAVEEEHDKGIYSFAPAALGALKQEAVRRSATGDDSSIDHSKLFNVGSIGQERGYEISPSDAIDRVGKAFRDPNFHFTGKDSYETLSETADRAIASYGKAVETNGGIDFDETDPIQQRSLGEVRRMKEYYDHMEAREQEIDRLQGEIRARQDYIMGLYDKVTDAKADLASLKARRRRTWEIPRFADRRTELQGDIRKAKNMERDLRQEHKEALRDSSANQQHRANKDELRRLWGPEWAKSIKRPESPDTTTPPQAPEQPEGQQ